jgi:hypothetical protein
VLVVVKAVIRSATPRPQSVNARIRDLPAAGTAVLSLRRGVKNGRLYPNQIVEKQSGVAATTRSWNTIEKVVKILCEPTEAGRLRPATAAWRDRKPPNSADQKQLQRLKAANGDQEEQRSHNA